MDWKSVSRIQLFRAPPMKIQFNCCLATFLCLLICGLTARPCLASGKHVHKSYQQRLVKSRAKRGYTNNGTVVYNYQEIDSYSDDLDDDTLGNIEVEHGSHVREVNNVVIIKGDVESEKDKLEIGKVKIKRSGRAGTVNNSVVIDGKLDASGESVSIGSIKVDGGGRLESLDNKIEIHGDIDAR